jgi:hypothetical protein
MTKIPFEDQSCKTCKYLYETRCHRYAPKPMIWHSPSGDGFGEWPGSIWPDVIMGSDWCGEWEARP